MGADAAGRGGEMREIVSELALDEDEGTADDDDVEAAVLEKYLSNDPFALLLLLLLLLAV
jgi:hypothetical protein